MTVAVGVVHLGDDGTLRVGVVVAPKHTDRIKGVAEISRPGEHHHAGRGNSVLFEKAPYIDMVLLDDGNRIMEKPWYFIQDTPGKIGIVGGDRPLPVTPDEIATIKEQISESEDTEKPKVHFDVGETVKINDGPFLNFSGVIEEIEPDRGKLKVTVNIFGRNTPVELEYWQVEKA